MHLYEAAFASLVKLNGSDSRNVITGITLIAGFASTVGWPLSSALGALVFLCLWLLSGRPQQE